MDVVGDSLEAIDIFSGQRWKPKKGLSSSTDRFFIMEQMWETSMTAQLPPSQWQIGPSKSGSWLVDMSIDIMTSLLIFARVLNAGVRPPQKLGTALTGAKVDEYFYLYLLFFHFSERCC